MLVAAGAEQVDAYGDVGGEVEEVSGRAVDGGRQFLVGDLVHTDLGGGRHGGVRGIHHHLLGSEGPVDEPGAQALVPPQEVGDGRAQGRQVELAGQPDREGQVVGGAGTFHPVEEVQALLGVRQRQRAGAGHRAQGGPGLLGIGEPQCEGRRGGLVEDGPDR